MTYKNKVVLIFNTIATTAFTNSIVSGFAAVTTSFYIQIMCWIRNIAMCRNNRQKGALLGWNRVNRGPVLRHDKDPFPGEGRKTRALVYMLQASWTIHNYTIYVIYKTQQPGNRGGGSW